MSEENKIKDEGAVELAGAYVARAGVPAFDLLQRWKIMSRNNVYIIYPYYCSPFILLPRMALARSYYPLGQL